MLGNGYTKLLGESSASLRSWDASVYREEVITPSQNNIISDVQWVSTAPTNIPVNDETCLGCELL